MPLFSQIFMNCNLVTELQIHCFNSLFCCRAADLFHQHSKYARNGFHVRSNSWEFICFFTVSAPTAVWTSENDFFFCPLQSNQVETKAGAEQVSSDSTLAGCCLQRGAGGQDTLPRSPTWVNQSGDQGELISHSDLSMPNAERLP